MSKKLLHFFFIILFITFGFNSFNCTRIVPENITLIIDEVENKYAPEKRVSVFDVTADIKRDTLILTGQVLSTDAKDDLMERLAQFNFTIKDQVVVLPHPKLGGKSYGIIRISTASLRRTPAYKAEMISEALMGSEIRILKHNDVNRLSWWRLCQMEDGYLGWMPTSSFSSGDSEFINNWRAKEKLVVTTNYCQMWEDTTEKSLPVSDLVRGNRIAKVATINDWIEVQLPDDRRGYVKAIYVTAEDSYLQKLNATRANILNTAHSLLGIPYLWGGTSIKGFDCSGFTQSVFKFNGIQLPRDANMQVNEGKEISIDENFQNLQPADLLFWGPNKDRIIHVGIYIGDKKFIHSDGMVRINSFDPGDDNYSEYRRRTLKAARRILE